MSPKCCLGLLLIPLLACTGATEKPKCKGVVCTAGATCDPLTGQCVVPTPDAGIGCAADLQCGASAPRCLTAESRCVACLSDVDCAAGGCDTPTHQCVALPDSCTTARTLDLSTGHVTLTADTSRANDDTKLSCALSGTKSNDLVWIVSIPERRRLVAQATPLNGSPLRPVLSLRTVCSSMDSALNLACAYPSTTGSIAKLTLDAVDPGTYYLWLEGEDANSGAFTLDVQLEVPPPSDSCAQPRQIAIVANNSEEILGDTRGLKDDAAGTCGGVGAPDAVYAVQLNAPRRLRIDVEGSTKGFQPVVYARTSCDVTTPTAQVGCVTSSLGPTALDIPRVEAGTIFIFVDGQTGGAGNAGTYRLRITPFDPVPPPTNDVCAAATALVMPPMALGVVSQQGDTSSATNDALGCNATGPDLVYKFTLPVARQVLARVTPLAGSGLRPAVYLRGAGKCDSEATNDTVACQLSAMPGGTATTVVPNLPAGVWYLWVDGVQGSGGPFDLKLELADPPPVPGNDTCSAATPLDLVTGVVNAQGTTLGANSDKLSTCTLPISEPSPDVVYEVKVPAQQSVAIDLRATTGSLLKPVATLRGATCASINPNDELACAWGDAQVPERSVFTIPVLDAGTYYLWVAGDDGSQGPFSLKLSGGPIIPPPANDVCSSAQPLNPGVFVEGDTRGASNDGYASGCGLTFGADGLQGPDVAFKFTLPNPLASLTLSVVPDPADGQLFRPVVYLKAGTSCFTSTTRGCAVAASYGGTATLTVNSLAAGAYTVWVDGAGQSSGKFTIKMQ